MHNHWIADQATADLYALTEEQVSFRDTIRQIAQERVAPRAAEIDEKAEYPHDLRQLLAEQDILALPFDEEHGGTDPGGMRTRAVRDGDEWVINGEKNWITNLGIADFFVVFAVTDPSAGHSRGI